MPENNDQQLNDNKKAIEAAEAPEESMPNLSPQAEIPAAFAALLEKGEPVAIIEYLKTHKQETSELFEQLQEKSQQLGESAGELQAQAVGLIENLGEVLKEIGETKLGTKLTLPLKEKLEALVNKLEEFKQKAVEQIKRARKLQTAVTIEEQTSELQGQGVLLASKLAGKETEKLKTVVAKLAEVVRVKNEKEEESRNALRQARTLGRQKAQELSKEELAKLDIEKINSEISKYQKEPYDGNFEKLDEEYKKSVVFALSYNLELRRRLEEKLEKKGKEEVAENKVTEADKLSPEKPLEPDVKEIVKPSSDQEVEFKKKLALLKADTGFKLIKEKLDKDFIDRLKGLLIKGDYGQEEIEGLRQQFIAKMKDLHLPEKAAEAIWGNLLISFDDSVKLAAKEVEEEREKFASIMQKTREYASKTLTRVGAMVPTFVYAGAGGAAAGKAVAASLVAFTSAPFLAPAVAAIIAGATVGGAAYLATKLTSKVLATKSFKQISGEAETLRQAREKVAANLDQLMAGFIYFENVRKNNSEALKQDTEGNKIKTQYLKHELGFCDLSLEQREKFSEQEKHAFQEISKKPIYQWTAKDLKRLGITNQDRDDLAESLKTKQGEVRKNFEENTLRRAYEFQQVYLEHSSEYLAIKDKEQQEQQLTSDERQNKEEIEKIAQTEAALYYMREINSLDGEVKSKQLLQLMAEKDPTLKTLEKVLGSKFGQVLTRDARIFGQGARKELAGSMLTWGIAGATGLGALGMGLSAGARSYREVFKVDLYELGDAYLSGTKLAEELKVFAESLPDDIDECLKQLEQKITDTEARLATHLYRGVERTQVLEQLIKLKETLTKLESLERGLDVIKLVFARQQENREREISKQTGEIKQKIEAVVTAGGWKRKLRKSALVAGDVLLNMGLMQAGSSMISGEASPQAKQAELGEKLDLDQEALTDLIGGEDGQISSEELQAAEFMRDKLGLSSANDIRDNKALLQEVAGDLAAAEQAADLLGDMDIRLGDDNLDDKEIKVFKKIMNDSGLGEYIRSLYERCENQEKARTIIVKMVSQQDFSNEDIQRLENILIRQAALQPPETSAGPAFLGEPASAQEQPENPVEPQPEIISDFIDEPAWQQLSEAEQQTISSALEVISSALGAETTQKIIDNISINAGEDNLDTASERLEVIKALAKVDWVDGASMNKLKTSLVDFDPIDLNEISKLPQLSEATSSTDGVPQPAPAAEGAKETTQPAVATAENSKDGQPSVADSQANQATETNSSAEWARARESIGLNDQNDSAAWDAICDNEGNPTPERVQAVQKLGEYGFVYNESKGNISELVDLVTENKLGSSEAEIIKAILARPNGHDQLDLLVKEINETGQLDSQDIEFLKKYIITDNQEINDQLNKYIKEAKDLRGVHKDQAQSQKERPEEEQQNQTEQKDKTKTTEDFYKHFGYEVKDGKVIAEIGEKGDNQYLDQVLRRVVVGALDAKQLAVQETDGKIHITLTDLTRIENTLANLRNDILAGKVAGVSWNESKGILTFEPDKLNELIDDQYFKHTSETITDKNLTQKGATGETNDTAHKVWTDIFQAKFATADKAGNVLVDDVSGDPRVLAAEQSSFHKLAHDLMGNKIKPENVIVSNEDTGTFKIGDTTVKLENGQITEVGGAKLPEPIDALDNRTGEFKPEAIEKLNELLPKAETKTASPEPDKLSIRLEPEARLEGYSMERWTKELPVIYMVDKPEVVIQQLSTINWENPQANLDGVSAITIKDLDKQMETVGKALDKIERQAAEGTAVSEHAKAALLDLQTRAEWLDEQVDKLREQFKGFKEFAQEKLGAELKYVTDKDLKNYGEVESIKFKDPKVAQQEATWAHLWREVPENTQEAEFIKEQRDRFAPDKKPTDISAGINDNIKAP